VAIPRRFLVTARAAALLDLDTGSKLWSGVMAREPTRRIIVLGIYQLYDEAVDAASVPPADGPGEVHLCRQMVFPLAVFQRMEG
jgi:hypothetical protein